MPTISDLFGSLGSSAMRAIGMLVSGQSYQDVYDALRKQNFGALPSQIFGAIDLAKEALAAVVPLGSRNRFRVQDIPQIGPKFTDVDQLSGNQRFRARGVATWIDPTTGQLQGATVFYSYDTLPSLRRINADLEAQFYHQLTLTSYDGRKTRGFEPSTLSIQFVAFTRSY